MASNTPGPDARYPGAGQPPPGQGAGQPFPAPARSAGAPPSDVRTSFLLWVVNLALGLLGLLISFLARDALIGAGIQEGLRQAGTTEAELPPGFLDQARADAAAGAGNILVSLAVLVLIGALIVAMRNGRNWARTTLTVVGVLSIVINLFALVTAPPLLGIGVLGVVVVLATVIQILLVIGAVVFMFRPRAQAYFAGRSSAA